MRVSYRKVIGWALVVVLVVALVPVDKSVNYERLVLGLNRPMPLTKIVEFDPTAVTGVVIGAILGGFREVAASMLWMKTDQMWHSGEGTGIKALNLMRTVTLLDPHWLEPWRITGWHLAYNLYVETKDPAQRAKFLNMGVDCLKEGISWNPDRYDLYFELGWTYFDKVKDYDEAAKWLGAAIQFDHPEYIERLIAHAYERIPDIPRALDWYDYCLKRNPADHTAVGATITIRERYLPAWRLMEQKKYDEAIREVDKYLAVEPNNTIPLHMKAFVFEKSGNLDKALEMWTLAGKVSAMDEYARTRAVDVANKLGKPLPGGASYIFEQQEQEKQRREQMQRGAGNTMAVPTPSDSEK
jgi:tetratricopeptide (TPR) repeat protein